MSTAQNNRFPTAMNGGEQTGQADARVGETHRRGIDAGPGDGLGHDTVRPQPSDDAREESLRDRDTGMFGS